MNQIQLVGILERDLFLLGKLNLTQNHTGLTNDLGKLSRVDSVKRRNVELLAPITQRASGIPVIVLVRVIHHDESSDMNLIALEMLRKSELVLVLGIGNSVITNQRIGKNQDLSSVGRIRERLGITDHTRVENDLSRDASVRTEGISTEFLSVRKNQLGCHLLVCHNRVFLVHHQSLTRTQRLNRLSASSHRTLRLGHSSRLSGTLRVDDVTSLHDV